MIVPELPSDIKWKIYWMAIHSELKDYPNRKKYNEVIAGLNEIIENNEEYGYVRITPSFIWEINSENQHELYQEEALDRYYELDFI